MTEATPVKLWWAGTVDGGGLFVAETSEAAIERAHEEFCDCHVCERDACIASDEWRAVDVATLLPAGQSIELMPADTAERTGLSLWWLINEIRGAFVVASSERAARIMAAAETGDQWEYDHEIREVDGYAIVAHAPATAPAPWSQWVWDVRDKLKRTLARAERFLSGGGGQ